MLSKDFLPDPDPEPPAPAPVSNTIMMALELNGNSKRVTRLGSSRFGVDRSKE